MLLLREKIYEIYPSNAFLLCNMLTVALVHLRKNLKKKKLKKLLIQKLATVNISSPYRGSHVTLQVINEVQKAKLARAHKLVAK